MTRASSAIEQQPFCWDNNGFYRRLGLPPGAPRIEVARSFMDLDGHRSSKLTNAVRVLVDKDTKRRYDALPLGVFWADDECLIRAVIDGEMESVPVVDEPWSYYVDEVSPESVDPDLLNEWRWMIAYLLWRSNSPVKSFAMGVSRDPFAAIVGFRTVAFVPLDFKPAWEYVSEIALALQRVQTS